MKIYVAAATADIDRAEQLISIIENDTPHEVTYDWTKTVRQYGRGDATETPPDVLAKAAEVDRQGVRDCDLFIILWHPNVYGALIELGMALENDKPVWMVCSHEREPRFSVFFCFKDNPMRMVAGWEVAQELKYGDLALHD